MVDLSLLSEELLIPHGNLKSVALSVCIELSFIHMGEST